MKDTDCGVFHFRKLARMSKKFTKNVEDFVCEKCGTDVHGNGFTNHCPACLWSKHVDVNPGDRAATCGGMMRPVRVETEHGEQVLVHVCQTCGAEKRNKVASDDNFDAVLAVAKEAVSMV